MAVGRRVRGARLVVLDVCGVGNDRRADTGDLVEQAPLVRRAAQVDPVGVAIGAEAVRADVHDAPAVRDGVDGDGLMSRVGGEGVGDHDTLFSTETDEYVLHLYLALTEEEQEMLPPAR